MSIMMKCLNDDLIHNIKIEHIYPINIGPSTYFIMEYLDEILDKKQLSLLTEINNKLTNIPFNNIEDYKRLYKLLKNSNDIYELDINKFNFPEKILLGDPININELIYTDDEFLIPEYNLSDITSITPSYEYPSLSDFKEPVKKEIKKEEDNEIEDDFNKLLEDVENLLEEEHIELPVIENKVYIPLIRGEHASSKYRIFVEDTIVNVPNEDFRYLIFTRDLYIKEREELIDEELKEFINNNGNVERIKINYTINKGEGGTLKRLNSNNEVEEVKLPLEPGNYETTVVFRYFENKEIYNKTLEDNTYFIGIKDYYGDVGYSGCWIDLTRNDTECVMGNEMDYLNICYRTKHYLNYIEKRK